MEKFHADSITLEAQVYARSLYEKPLTDEQVATLTAEIYKINAAKDLHIQLIQNEPKAFSGFLARYIKFSGATNYIALVGRKSDDLKEKLGYEGEKLVLMAQQMGLNTCWVAGMPYAVWVRYALSVCYGLKKQEERRI